MLSRPRVVIPILSWLSGVKGDCCLKLFKPCAVQLLCGFFDLFFKDVNVCLAEGEMIKWAKITGNKSVGYRSGEKPYRGVQPSYTAFIHIFGLDRLGHILRG